MTEEDKDGKPVTPATPPPPPVGDKPAVADGGISSGTQVPSGPQEMGELDTKAELAAVDSKSIIFVRGDDRDMTIAEAVRIAKNHNLLLLDGTRPSGDGRAPAIEALLVGLRAMKGLAPIVVHADLGPTDVGDPNLGIVVNVHPATVRARPEKQYWVESEAYTNRPSWLKKRA